MNHLRETAEVSFKGHEMITLKKPLRFQDIPQFMKGAPSRVDLPWQEISRWISCQPSLIKIDPDPFQRKEWTLKEKGAYIEYCLQGGFTASSIYFNWNGEQRWQGGARGSISNDSNGSLVLVDGKERISAITSFLEDEVPVFGNHVFSDFEDKLRMTAPLLHITINELKTEEEVINFYLDLNDPGRHTRPPVWQEYL